MRLSLLFAALVVVSPLALHATTIFSTSFEGPQFTTGTLNGQNGFFHDTAAIGQVESGIANSGTQAVEFNANGTSGQNVALIDTAFTASPGNETATIQIAAMFTSSTSASIYEVLGLDSSSGFLTQIAYFNGGAYFVMAQILLTISSFRRRWTPGMSTRSNSTTLRKWRRVT
jgi:hypothetical protein